MATVTVYNHPLMIIVSKVGIMGKTSLFSLTMSLTQVQAFEDPRSILETLRMNHLPRLTALA